MGEHGAVEEGGNVTKFVSLDEESKLGHNVHFLEHFKIFDAGDFSVEVFNKRKTELVVFDTVNVESIGLTTEFFEGLNTGVVLFNLSFNPSNIALSVFDIFVGLSQIAGTAITK